MLTWTLLFKFGWNNLGEGTILGKCCGNKWQERKALEQNSLALNSSYNIYQLFGASA